MSNLEYLANVALYIEEINTRNKLYHNYVSDISKNALFRVKINDEIRIECLRKIHKEIKDIEQLFSIPIVENDLTLNIKKKLVELNDISNMIKNTNHNSDIISILKKFDDYIILNYINLKNYNIVEVNENSKDNVLGKRSREEYEKYNKFTTYVVLSKLKQIDDNFEDKIKSNLKLLKHSLTCNESNCKLTNCNSIKKYQLHYQFCKNKNCLLFKGMSFLYKKHSCECDIQNCNLPYCIKK